MWRIASHGGQCLAVFFTKMSGLFWPVPCIWIPPAKSGLGNQREFSVLGRCWIWHLTRGILFFTVYSVILLHETDLLRHLLQHRGGRAIARKKRQAHARVAHCNGCLTGAETTAPSVGEPAHHPLDRMGFYGFGQTLKLAICEKCRNPKNSDNAVLVRHQRMIVGLYL